MEDDVPGEEKSVMEYLRKEFPDWDDEVKCTARFKAFSGQRTDWEPLYVFWRDLILKVARHLHIFIIHPSQVKTWFHRGGLVPLCLDQVLLEMNAAGELLRNVGVADPASSWVSQIFRRVVNLGGLLRPSTQEKLAEDYYIIPMLLKEKALQVVQALSERHWTASCVITWAKFQEISGGLKEAHAVLNHLCDHGKAKYLVTTKKDLMEVAEAIRIGTQAIKENGINYDEVELCLQELNECIESQKQIDEILGSSAAGAEIEDEDIEEELKELELNFAEVPPQTSTGLQVTADALSDSLSKLHLTHHARKEAEAEDDVESMSAVSKDVNCEAVLS